MLSSKSYSGGPPVRVLDSPLASISEFDTWKFSMLYQLRLNADFRVYLRDENFQFGAKSLESPNRNFVDITHLVEDPQSTTTPKRTITVVKSSAEDQCFILDLMLDTIAQYLPKIPHNDIVQDCASLSEVWQVVRLHSNIQTSGALLNNIWNITRHADETPQALYSRVKQAYDDCLIRKNTIVYKTAALTVDEQLSPTLHNTIILHWLQILHPKLRDLVTQRFCTQLRGASYAALWPEISKSIDMLLQELSSPVDQAICRFNDFSRSDGYSASRSRGSYPRFRGNPRRSPVPSQSKQCDYCRLLNKRGYQSHSIDQCMYIKRERQQRQPSGFNRAFEAEEYDEHLAEFYEDYPQFDDLHLNSMNKLVSEHVIRRISVESSPFLTLSADKVPYDVTLDTGGTCSAIDAATAADLKCKIHTTYQRARCADSMTLLDVIGETEVEFERHGKVYNMNALVFNSPDRTVLAGVPFMKKYDISVRPALSQVEIHGVEVFNYKPSKVTNQKIRRFQSFTVRSPTHTVILPGEALQVPVPAYLLGDKVNTVAVEPRYDNSIVLPSSFPAPSICSVEDGSISLKNTSQVPVIVKKNEHLCKIQPPVPESEMPQLSQIVTPPTLATKKVVKFSEPVQVNPDGTVLTPEFTQKFRSLVEKFDDVFNPAISMYNGKSGKCQVEVNMGPNPPPQHKGRVPFYGRDNMLELQEKFDELVKLGVFKRPQDLGITAEIINPSFLVKKQDSNEKRLVTDFGSIADYCRPTPTKMPDVETTLRHVAGWGYILKCDFKSSYWQLVLRRSSMKYCGVCSPMKGVYVYTRGAMGLPGTEVALEELTCRLFGHLVKQGKLAKIADDVFMGANSVQELYDTFAEVLEICAANNLKLSAKKTIICPISVMILGWIWKNGCLSASPHKLSALSECDPPSTVKALKSYIGAYRFLSRVIKDYATSLQPLEKMIAGNQAPNTKIAWSDELLQVFKAAQVKLKDAKSIVLPKPTDVLQIVTDAAVLPGAVGAVMYAIRNGKPLLAGYYNAKLPQYKTRWLPCELEGVAIGAALTHFGPYLRESLHKPIILTDSKACCDAIQRFKQGCYSTSSRLCTFLSTVHRYGATVKHIAGVSNTVSDYLSRHPIPCDVSKCAICTFLQDSMDAVVGAISVSDVVSGKVHLPFTNKRSWVEIQRECPDLRRVFNYIENGTQPGKSGRNLRRVKRYMSSKVVMSVEGALVVHDIEPFSPVTERIVVPQKVLHGILTVLHLRLEHPTDLQLSKIFSRYFFALNLGKAVALCSKACHDCAALKTVPSAMREESTDVPPEQMFTRFAGDVIKRHSQLILVLRETTSSYTQAEIINSETAEDISTSLHRLSNLMRPSKLVPISIRLDPHASHKSLYAAVQRDQGLAKYNVQIELGRELNLNKNPVAEKAVRELIREIQVLSPEGGKISITTLSEAVASLNARIRAPGLSAHEIFTRREQVTGRLLEVDDIKLILDQHHRRCTNHRASEKNKSHSKPPHPSPVLEVGDIVYLYDDRSKLTARPRYLVVGHEEGFYLVRRLCDKMMGAKSYKVKSSECYKVEDEFQDMVLPPYPYPDDPDMIVPIPDQSMDEDSESEDEIYSESEEEEGSAEESSEDSQLDNTQPDEQSAPEESDSHEDATRENSDSHEDAVPEESDQEYPCSICHKEVSQEESALACDTCGDWCHIECGRINEEDYNRYQEMFDANETIQWDCPACLDDEEEDPPYRG